MTRTRGDIVCARKMRFYCDFVNPDSQKVATARLCLVPLIEWHEQDLENVARHKHLVLTLLWFMLDREFSETMI